MRRESAAISPVSEVIAAIRGGEIVILVDDEDRENEGDLVFAAEFVTPEKINFLAKHGRGLICMPITEEHAGRLGLRPMVEQNRSRHGTNFTVSIEAAEGIATGISAHDRALTVKIASSAKATAADIVQPGHVFPLIAHPGGVLVRAGHTEACCDLAQLAAEHKLRIGTIADLIEHRSHNESLVKRIHERDIETPWGNFHLVSYRDLSVGSLHLALVHGTPEAKKEALVRVHEPTSVVDLLDAGKGTHSWGVGETLSAIQQAPAGVMVLMNCNQDGSNPPQAARSVDLRLYGIGAQILRDLGVGKMRLMAAPRKMPSMAGFGLEVTGYIQR